MPSGAGGHYQSVGQGLLLYLDRNVSRQGLAFLPLVDLSRRLMGLGWPLRDSWLWLWKAGAMALRSGWRLSL